MIEVATVDCAKGIAWTEDGQKLSITNAWDDYGDEVEIDDPAAIVCCAGPDKDGLWLTIDFREMETVTLQ